MKINFSEERANSIQNLVANELSAKHGVHDDNGHVSYMLNLEAYHYCVGKASNGRLDKTFMKEFQDTLECYFKEVTKTIHDDGAMENKTKDILATLNKLVNSNKELMSTRSSRYKREKNEEPAALVRSYSR